MPVDVPLSHYWPVVFVQMLSLVLYCCSWIPLWRIPSLTQFHNAAVNGIFMLPHLILAILLPAGVALQLGIYFIIVDDGHDERSYTTAYVLLIVQMAVFSIWLVPYAARREAWWSLALLVVCVVLGVAVNIFVAVPVTGSGMCARALAAVVVWNAALALLALLNAMFGVRKLLVSFLKRDEELLQISHVDDEQQQYDTADAATNEDLANRLANPFWLTYDLLVTLAG